MLERDRPDEVRAAGKEPRCLRAADGLATAERDTRSAPAATNRRRPSAGRFTVPSTSTGRPVPESAIASPAGSSPDGSSSAWKNTPAIPRHRSRLQLGRSRRPARPPRSQRRPRARDGRSRGGGPAGRASRRDGHRSAGADRSGRGPARRGWRRYPSVEPGGGAARHVAGLSPGGRGDARRRGGLQVGDADERARRSTMPSSTAGSISVPPASVALPRVDQRPDPKACVDRHRPSSARLRSPRRASGRMVRQRARHGGGWWRGRSCVADGPWTRRPDSTRTGTSSWTAAGSRRSPRRARRRRDRPMSSRTSADCWWSSGWSTCTGTGSRARRAASTWRSTSPVGSRRRSTPARRAFDVRCVPPDGDRPRSRSRGRIPARRRGRPRLDARRRARGHPLRAASRDGRHRRREPGCHRRCEGADRRGCVSNGWPRSRPPSRPRTPPACR